MKKSMKRMGLGIIFLIAALVFYILDVTNFAFQTEQTFWKIYPVWFFGLLGLGLVLRSLRKVRE